ncbi:MAG: hypothetical protein K9J81_06370 [Desulfohalobiaceae bacterium]|nr:hypothetical protein [Desulfohalobiaceae bacterium]
MSDEINKPHDNVVKNILGRESIAKENKTLLPIVIPLVFYQHRPKGGETVRTTAEVLRQEGKQEGLQQKPQ